MKKILSFLLLLVISLSLAGCNNQKVDPIYGEVRFALIGDENMFITANSNYTEKGFFATDDKTDITSYVTFSGTVDTATPGEYILLYTLNYNEVETVLTRNVTVLYPNTNCTLINDTNTMACSNRWSSYLHTVVDLTIYFDKTSLVDSIQVFNDIEDIIAYYHIISDKYDNYDGYTNIKTINDSPYETHTIPQELYDLLDFTFSHQAEVDNLFNAALGPVISVWHDYRENCNNNDICEVPTMQELNAANQYTNTSNIILDETNLTITMEPHMSLDLGGVSKGYISGKIIEYLDTINLSAYLLNNGTSNISIGGTHPTRESQKFVIGITDPTNIYSQTGYALINLSDGDQLVTSGDYQQYYMVDDVLYHHIIHNVTLFPERYCRSVSIATSDPALADLYSTAIFLMPIEEGIDFVDGIDGLEAIWYGLDGTIYFSENFESDYLLELR